MEQITDRISRVARSKGIKNAQMASTCDVSEAAVSKWFSSGKIDKDHFPPLAGLLGCSIDYIMTGSESLVMNSSEGLAIRAVPIIALPDIARYLRGETTESDLMNKLPVAHAEPGSFGFVVEGDTMVNPAGLPTYPPGCVCICKKVGEAESGKRVVVDIPGSGVTFKELLVDAGAKFLKPLNPRYPVLPMPDNAVILGVVIQMAVPE